MKQEDVQALVDQLFSMDKPVTAKVSEFRVYYNDFGEIVSLAPKEIEEYKEHSFIRVSKERYLELQDSNLKNFFVDTGQSPPQIINISKDAMATTNAVHLIEQYNPKRLFRFEFDSVNRKLHLQANGNLPDSKTIWVVPKGQYSIMLKQIEIKSTTEETFDIDDYLDTKDINLITRQNLDMLVSYRKAQ
jgi:hypothetical protein